MVFTTDILDRLTGEKRVNQLLRKNLTLRTSTIIKAKASPFLPRHHEDTLHPLK